MNNLQATKALDRIFNSESKIFHKKVCVLIDGVWGIGKTYFIQNYFSEKGDEYEFIYTSVFGKNSVKDIEKSILIHSLPGINKINEDGSFAKIAQNVINDLGNKFLGISVENYINSFSIEDIKWDTNTNKRRIICFDDFERKPDSITIKELLGLVQRTTKIFDVLIISNINELDGKDIEIFKTHKEKVIDHIIKIDDLHKSTLTNILENMKEDRTEIIDTYLSNNIAIEKSKSWENNCLINKIQNLRVFIKYVELILRLETYLGKKVDKDFFKMCKIVICDHYFPDKKDKKDRMSFDRFNIYKNINILLLNEDVDRDEFQEYFIANSEIRIDIGNIYSAYRINEREFNSLIEKINQKIENKDLEYFIKQENVISLVSALNELIEIQQDVIKDLCGIAIDLYSPEKYRPHIKISCSQWNGVDNYGNEIECDEKIRLFIETINQKCVEKFEGFIKGKLKAAKTAKNYEELLKLYSFCKIDEIKDFEEIFDYYFVQLLEGYSIGIEEKINDLINRTKSELICNFFLNRIKTETQITQIMKYKHFDFELERKMEYEAELENYISNPPEEIEGLFCKGD